MHLACHAIHPTHAVHRDAGQHGQIGAPQMGCQVGFGRAEALARPLRDLVEPRAFLRGPIEIGIARQARLHRGLDKAVRKHIRALQIGHIQGPLLTMPFVGQTLVVLRLQKVGQHIGPRPTRTTHIRPGVVIPLLAPDVGHRIDGTGAPQRAAAGLKTAAPQQARLRHRGQALRDPFGAGHQGDAGRAMDQGTGVGRPGFQQCHLHIRVFAQATGQHTTGRATAHDHVIKVHGIPLPKFCGTNVRADPCHGLSCMCHYTRSTNPHNG